MKSSNYLPFARPFYSELEREAILKVIESGWLATGKEAQTFERNMELFLGTGSALALSSCTAALHVALHAWGIHGSDEVVTTPYTFCATIESIEYCNAVPILVDIDRATGNLDVLNIERCLSSSTRVILPVHYAGLPCDMDDIMELARTRDVRVLEDAALAIGSEYGSRKIGTVGDATAFSFYSTKNLTTGEGGMLCSADSEFISKCRKLSLHGMSGDAWKRYKAGGAWRYDVEMLGFKYNMPDILAVLGVVQLGKLSQITSLRQEIARRYISAFREFDFLEPFHWDLANGGHSRHLFPIVLKLESLAIGRDSFIQLLNEEGIGTSVHYIPIHYHSYFAQRYGWKKGAFPNAEWLFERIISLPIYPGLDFSQVDRVITTVESIGKKYRK